MTRQHRGWHAWTWLVLGPLLVLGFLAGVMLRPTPVAEATVVSLPRSVNEPEPREATP